MNALSTVISLLAQATPKAADKAPESEPLLVWWQYLLILVLIGLIVFYVLYKKKQNQG